jgi:hypothetical protein
MELHISKSALERPIEGRSKVVIELPFHFLIELVEEA